MADWQAPAETVMPVTLEPARPADLELLLGFMRDYYVLDHLAFDRQRAARALSRLMDDPSAGFVWLIHAEADVIGYLVLTLGYSLEYHGRDAFIDELFLDAPFRGRGYGKQVMALVEDQARRLNVQAIHLEVERDNTRAQALYRTAGYGEHDRFLMTKRLHPTPPSRAHRS